VSTSTELSHCFQPGQAKVMPGPTPLSKSHYPSSIRYICFRISYCSADATYDHVFALIATNKNDTLECHAFLCPKKKMVRFISILCPTSGKIAGLLSCVVSACLFFECLVSVCLFDCLPVWLPHQPARQTACLPGCLPARPHAFKAVFMPACLPDLTPSKLSSCFRALPYKLPSCQRACLTIHPLLFLLCTCLPT
jgi:hypothetical protein